MSRSDDLGVAFIGLLHQHCPGFERGDPRILADIADAIGNTLGGLCCAAALGGGKNAPSVFMHHVVETAREAALNIAAKTTDVNAGK